MELKDKPNSMSVREWLTKKLAVKIMIPENVIRQVVTHQFDSAYEALKVNNSLEISGFGKFFYNTKKADKEIEFCEKQAADYRKCLEEEESEAERDKIRTRIGQVDLKLKRLIKKKSYGEG